MRFHDPRSDLPLARIAPDVLVQMSREDIERLWRFIATHGAPMELFLIRMELEAARDYYLDQDIQLNREA